MIIRILKKVQPAQWLSAIGLLGMMAICIRIAIAVTAFTPNTMPTGVTAQEVVSNATLVSGTESLFRTDFEKEFWSGNIYDYPIDANGYVNTSGERWSGGLAPNLAAQNFSTGRFIGTMTVASSGVAAKVGFVATNLSATQQATLGATIQGTTYTATQMVNFLRGDHTLEGITGLRQRLMPGTSTTLPTVLGDIVHCRPFYLSDVTNPTIFVGANDGMLHAVNTNTGTESWAYVPSMLISKMKALAANPYTHDYYVDGQLAVGFSNVNKRFLVGALGAGGKGLYALNIDGSTGLTAANDQAVADKIMWEITPTAVNYVTSTSYSNLGYTLSAPLIKTINNNGTAQRVIMVGNGYNDGGDYQAYLYVINPDDGSLIGAIKADSTSANTTGTAVTQGTAASPNGLMNLLAFDSNGDSYTDTVYAGDLNGTMWKFNLMSITPSAWTSSVLFKTNPQQPITATPAALPHPSGTGYVVDFATGSIFTGTQPASGVGATGDLGDTSSFYVYGIWDGAPSSNTTLVTPTITERCYDAASAPTSLPCSTTSSTVTRVRRISASNPNWSAGGDKGWKTALPIGGERVVGDGSFISSGRYYFSTYNPTISYLVPSTSTYVWGENWQMALDAVTGGSIDPFMDLSGDGYITPDDRVKYIASENTATTPVNTPILTPNVDGIVVGKWVGRGVQSQPVLVKLANLFTTLFNTNPDVSIPIPPVVGTGVTGGHFDEDIYYGGILPPVAATATITLSAQTKGVPTTLGGVTVDGATVIPALTFADGSATTTNASTIANSVTGGIYTAKSSGNTVTFTAPIGAAHNGKTLVVLTGNASSTVQAAVNATQSITFTNATSIQPTGVTLTVNGTNILSSASPGSAMSANQLATWVSSNLTPAFTANYNVSVKTSTVTFTAKTAITSTYDLSSLTLSSTMSSPAASTIIGTATTTAGKNATAASGKTKATKGSAASVSFSFTNTSAASLSGFGVTINGTAGTMAATNTSGPLSSSNLASWVASNLTQSGYSVKSSGSTVTITATAVGTGSNISSITFTGNVPAFSYTLGAAVAGMSASGQNDILSALTVVNFKGGSDGGYSGDTCTGANNSTCNRKTHDHQYDKIYDVTGVDMLNPNDVNFLLSQGVPNVNQNFKVIASNQYLNPAVQLNIGNSGYLPSVPFGYVSVQSYTTGSTLDLTSMPTFNQNPSSNGDGFAAPKYISSLVVNMPIDALTAKNWWGNGDVRSGLIPTQPGCVFSSAGANDGNMYQPVIPPANGVDGPGVLGYSGSTTPATATGVRHGGAFTLQIIDAATPNSALEMQITGRPEYGWRVKSALYSTYVLTEYNTYWHHPNKLCYGDTGWIKGPGPDTGGNPPKPIHTPGATDPKLGNLSGNSGTSTVTGVTRAGNTTTITYANGTSTVIIRVVNADGTVTTITFTLPSGVTGATAIINSDRSVVVTAGGVSTTIAVGSSATLSNGAIISNSTTANSAGGNASGGLLNQNAVGYKRVSWKELHRD